MALTQPFINTISAFDATIGTLLNVNILGGDAITGFQVELYENTGTQTPFYTFNVSVPNDIAGATIRTYPFTLNAGIGGITNNNKYSIACRTYNALQPLPQGQVGIQTTFNCYATPTISLEYLTLNGYQPIELNSQMLGTTQSFQVIFNSNDLNSIAQPNTAQFILYGVDSNNQQHFISQTEDIYNYTHTGGTSTYSAIFNIEGFSANTDSGNVPTKTGLYSSFTIAYTLSTVENMQLSGNFTNINCYYDVLGNSPYITVYNLCNKGVIQINCSLTSLQGTSNIPLGNLSYPAGQELDLRTATYSPQYSEAWVQWEKYFTLQTPYSLRIWGRAFDIGEIATFTHSIYVGNYVNINYNNDGTNTYISLESGQNNSLGQPMYPYYIESAYIPTNTITDTTNLFINIQQSNGLFEIDFQILT